MEKKNRMILNSMLAKIVAFFVLAVSLFVSVGGTVLSVMLWEERAYTSGVEPIIQDLMTSRVWEDVGYVEVLYQKGDIEGIETFLDRHNISMEILDVNEKDAEDAVLLWGNYDGAETKYSFNCFTDMFVNVEIKSDEADRAEEAETNSSDNSMVEVESETITVSRWREILFRVYVDDSFPIEDEYKVIYDCGMFFKDWIYVIPTVSVISIFLFVFSFIFLMCSAGHHRGQEGITGGVLYFFPLDIITVFFGGVALLGIAFFIEITRSANDLVVFIFLLGILVLEVIWCTIYCMEFATELKKGTLFKHTLIYVILRKCGRIVRAIWRGFVTMLMGLPSVMTVVIAYIAFSFVQFATLFFFCYLRSMDGDVLVLCLLEKIVLFPIVLYVALVCKKLQQGSEALAEGKLAYKLDTSKMIPGFKKHGENLNRIGEGIALAVEERMRSEHLKTELITNVSHDLKTPLTSIINYADLLGTAVKADGEVTDCEGIDREQLAEYSDVLLRQSKRLKKLLEDLVEASKATTGNLEVNLVPCEISVILSQAIGEYEMRFAQKQLELIVRQPQEPVNILADGRHLWRVFDNLMNNICKYAQESTRVYLTVEPKEGIVEIVFRNMSKYPLELSGEELQERFVRGDKSRHMEGNGLGLSIAGSLVELQNGTMEIVIDGDLFKVILKFPVL